jgi:hypothetical protein
MRTVIFIVGLLIADALNHQMKPEQGITEFCVILFLIFSCMDIVEFFDKFWYRNNKK